VRVIVYAALLAVLGVLSGCASGKPVARPGPGAASPATSEPLTGKLVITGSSTIAPLGAEMGKKFESLHPDVRVDVQSGGSGRGVADARSGVADIGMVSRALNQDETDLHPALIARDGVCMILHKDNPVSELKDEQVVAIYTGKITNWKEIGGKDAAITVVNKAEGRSTLELFCHFYKLKSPDIKAHVVIGDNEQGVKTVAGNPDAIGYVSIGTAEYNSKAGTPIKLLPCNGVPATLENVKAAKFPLARELNLVTKEGPKGLAKAFIDFATSKDANGLIKEQFFVPIKD
jgi:phosphate transport system substrate-binding protein